MTQLKETNKEIAYLVCFTIAETEDFMPNARQVFVIWGMIDQAADSNSAYVWLV